MPSYLVRRLANAGLQLAALMMVRIRIIQRATHGGGSSQFWLCGKPLLLIAPYGPWFKTARNAAGFLEMLLNEAN
jgi:hypothetical protein